jgi:hypothetical protein
MAFVLKWSDGEDTGFMHDGEQYSDMTDAEITASMAYDDALISPDDTVLVFDSETEQHVRTFTSEDF